MKTAKKNTLRFTSRIKTLNDAFIAIGQVNYGTFNCYWLNENMQNPKLAMAEQWFWATTWGQQLEFGEWEVDTEFFISENIEFDDIKAIEPKIFDASYLYSNEEWFSMAKIGICDVDNVVLSNNNASIEDDDIMEDIDEN